MAKIAVVLVNLGGPDSPEAVEPFLYHLFSDPAIIGLPGMLRRWLAGIIARRRAPKAREIYQQLGGKSPLLDYTQNQADALEKRLREADPLHEYGIFVAMRYWHPFTQETVAKVKKWGAEKLIFLPLYPQFSTTTTGSSLNIWRQEAKRQGLDADSQAICCYPTEKHFIAAHVKLLEETAQRLPDTARTRILFSAHGLPEKVVKAGDPYQWQVEQTSALVMEHLKARTGIDWDWTLGYQSRVGPLKWIGPSTESCIHAAGKEGRDLIVVPVAFVSEHSETLVELDIEYAELAKKAGVGQYLRVPALNATAEYIEALAGLCISSARRGIRNGLVRPHFGHLGNQVRLCPEEWRQCPCNAA